MCSGITTIADIIRVYGVDIGDIVGVVDVDCGVCGVGCYIVGLIDVIICRSWRWLCWCCWVSVLCCICLCYLYHADC